MSSKGTHQQQLHERLRELLPAARAESCQVVVTFLDIRGFSTFSAQGESFDAALYLRGVFSQILDNYFPDVTYLKPTGDGLLLIHELPSEAGDVGVLVSSVLERCLHLVEEFGQLTNDDVMVNFDVPKLVGAGVSRGSATRLVSEGMVLDYTGRCLNLAARLMDKARPSGVVFHDQRASQLMSERVTELFRPDEVCIRGISEDKPIAIFVSKRVVIRSSDRVPPTKSDRVFGYATDMSVVDVQSHSSYSFYLPRPPRRSEIAVVEVNVPIFDNQGRRTDSVTRMNITGEVTEDSDGWVVAIPFTRVKSALKNVPATTTGKVLGFTKTTRVTFTPYCRPKKAQVHGDD